MKKNRKYFLLVLLFLIGVGLILYFYLSSGIVTVTVIDSQTNQLVKQAVVEVDTVQIETLDGAAGIFGFDPEGGLLSRRLVNLTLSAPGYIPLNSSVSVSHWRRQKNLTFPVEPTMITGQVTDGSTGSPILSTVYILSKQELEQAVETDDNGYFELLYLEPPLTLRIEAPGYDSWQTQLDKQSFTTTNPPQFEVSLPQKITTGRLRVAGTNEPMADVILTTGQQTITTSVKGDFEFSRLLPGDIITVIAPPGYRPTEVVFDNQAELPLELTPRQVVITVQNIDTGFPATGVNISFDDNITAVTDSQGRAKLSLIPATGQITLSHPGYDAVTVDYNDEESLTIKAISRVLEGVVRDSTGTPLPQATIYVGDTVLRADDEGRFLLENLPDSPTTLMVKTSGYHRGYAQLERTKIITGYSPPFSGVEGRWLQITPCLKQAEIACMDILLEPFQAKAIYVQFNYLRSRKLMLGYLDLISSTNELNAMVVDVKGDLGLIGWPSKNKTALEINADDWLTDRWMPLDELVREAKKRNVYIIARMVIFKDDPLAYGKPELAAVDADGEVWIDGEDLAWSNPFKEDVWDYNIALAEEVATFGFDEINFDYIRFPSDGKVKAITYEEENSLETRTAAIGGFIERMSTALRPYGLFISADVFGLTIWVTPKSDMNIGQRVMDIAPHIDYLAPMIYPSTFIPGNLGYDDPSAEPYGVIYDSQLQAVKRVPPYVKVRPWLQAYWYSLEEMQLEKQAAIDANSTGWTWWSAGGRYKEELFFPVEQ